MPSHSYSPYWPSNSTNQQYVLILPILMADTPLRLNNNVCLVLLLVSNHVCNCYKCTMNVRLAVVHSNKYVASLGILAWIMGLTGTETVRELQEMKYICIILSIRHSTFGTI